MYRSLLLATVIAIPTLLHADRFGFAILETYTIPVVPISNTTFETIEADGAGGTQLWCAAGIFTRRVMGVDRGDLTIKQARGPSQTVQGRKSVVFTTEAVAGATRSYSEGVRTAGKTFSIGHANALCGSDLVGNVRIRLPDGRLVRR